jgi:hypothetical protein
MHETAADRQHLDAALKVDGRGFVFAAHHAADYHQVDHGRAVHLGELRRGKGSIRVLSFGHIGYTLNGRQFIKTVGSRSSL